MEELVFNGFSDKTFNFLKGIEKNNNKEWFEKHKSDYQKYLLGPMRALVEELSFTMLGIDSMIEVEPVINKTISRIYNDRRFAKNKPPYKATMWIKFHRPRKDWQILPGFFFETTPRSYSYGMGPYQTTPTIMETFRDQIDKNPQKFLEIINPINKAEIFSLEGEEYKKNKKIFGHKEIDKWYNKKSFYLISIKPIDNTVKSIKLVDEIITGYKLLEPLYNFIWKVIKPDVFKYLHQTHPTKA